MHDIAIARRQVEGLGRLLGQTDDAGWVVDTREARGLQLGTADQLEELRRACARRSETRRASRW